MGATSGLNQAQKRRLLVTFRYVDQLLGSAARTLAASGGPSLFEEHVPDATPVQAKVIEDSVRHLRGALLRILEAYGIPPPVPSTSAIWSTRVSLLSAEIAVEELLPGGMRGYGPLPPEAARGLEETVAELRGHLLRMTEYLARGPGGDLQARLERLGAAVEGTAGEELRRLERIITEHGLVHLRPALEALIDRLAVPRFEIALFGRVSAGKSSLLNHLIRQQVLPVGVTPVTAVPVRIGWGEEPGARITLADGLPQTVPLSRLADFAAEENNPGNERHVAGIEVFLAEPRLAGGVVFVDTPGLGSLATRGAAETLAYLPRCDLGVVLIDSGAAAAQEDLTVVEGLLASGARVLVLLSKADLLSPEDRERVRRYTEEKLLSQVGVAVAVAPVSVRGAAAALADAWFEREILPLAAVQRAEATASLRRKTGGLREAVERALADKEKRRAGAAAGDGPSPDDGSEPIEAALRSAVAACENALRECREFLSDLPLLCGEILAEAAADAATRWPAGGFSPELPAEVLASAASRRAGDAAARLVAFLEDLRRKITDRLTAAGVPADEAAALPPLSGLPVPDFDRLAAGAMARPWLAFLGEGYLRRRLAPELRRRSGAALAEALHAYERHLRHWSQAIVAGLRTDLAARGELLQSLTSPSR